MPKPLSDVVAQRVRQIRIAKGWSQEQLAEAAGLSRDAVSRIERHDRAARLDTVASIAEGLGVEVAALVGTGTRVQLTGADESDSGSKAAVRALRSMRPAMSKAMVRVLAVVAAADRTGKP